jgi:hypothetical protein
VEEFSVRHTFLFVTTTCGGIHSEKRKGRKSKFLFTAQLLGKWNLFRDFQRVQIYSIAHKKQKRITAGTQS